MRHDDPQQDPMLIGWVLTLEADEGYPPTTVRTYRAAVLHFLRWLAETHQRSAIWATRTDIREWVQFQRQTSIPVNSIHLRVIAIKKFYRWGVAEGDIAESPADKVKIPERGEPKTPVLGNDEIRRLLRACDGDDFLSRRNCAIVRILLDTGIRRNELAGILHDEIDVIAGTIVVRGKGAKKAGSRVRVVQMGNKCTRAVMRYLLIRATHPAADLPDLWLSHQHRPLTGYGIYHAVKSLGKRANVDGLHPHMGRHKWADNAKRSDMRDEDIKTLAGWRSQKTLERYGKAGATERALDAAKRLSLGDTL